MQATILNIGLAFVEGMALIISPCILPVLPVILAGSLEGGRRRPLGILIGFILSFALFTISARALVTWFNFDLQIIRYVSFVLLLALGIIMISNYLTDKFEYFTARFANIGANLSQSSRQDFVGGLVFGALIGLVWTPCAGPILAAVIVQSVLQQSNLNSLLTLLAFGIGVAIPMGLIIIFGRTILSKFNLLQRKAVLIRKIVGFIIILSVAVMIFGVPFLDRNVQDQTVVSGNELKNGLIMSYPAPDFAQISAWINSPPLEIKQLKGKVVLVDFWAYSCINCIRTLPYLVDWYAKYKDQGLVIVGVHSPEFDFERSEANVQAAVQKFGIKYPVALDNEFATWNNYKNHYWPAHFLIDKNGDIVYEHFGEGQYNVTENNIRYLLGLKATTGKAEASTIFNPQTPETYFGYARIDSFLSPEDIVSDAPAIYSYPKTLPANAWALSGSWTIAQQKIISQQPNAALKLQFHAKNVFAVMGSPKAAMKIKVLYNGAAPPNKPGSDVVDGVVEVGAFRLYTLLNLPATVDGEIELISSEPGLEVYTFTFGS